MRRTLLIHLESALLVGGYSSPSGFLHATAAVDANGTPFLPASALKGALREAVTRLHDGCTLVTPCGDPPCFACRLFGRAGTGTADMLGGADAEEVQTGKLRVGAARHPDPVCEDVLRRSLNVRHGVAIDRQQRSASPGLLVQREVADAPGTVLHAQIEGELTAEEWQKLEYALPLLDGIGNSRTRGLGRVRVELGEPVTARREMHVLPAEAPGDGAALVEIEALEPLVLGGLPPASNLVPSIGFIPGSAIRGMLGNAAVGLGKESAFHRAFLDPEHRLLFSDAHPAGKRGELTIPVPRSSLECKNHRRSDHDKARKGKPAPPPVDGLVAMALLDQLLAEVGGAPEPLRCDVCGEPLKRADGTWPRAESSVRRLVTRLGRDIATGSAMPQMLYSVEQYEVGTRFAGTVAGLDGEALTLLRASASAELRVGRGRSRGQGLIRLRITPAKDEIGAAAVSVRTKRFNDDVAPVREAFRAPSGKPAGCLVAVLARTDLACPPLEAEALVRGALFVDPNAARVVAIVQATTARSGWDEGKAPGSRAGYRPAVPAVAAGSAWLFALEPGIALDALRIARAEVRGIGDRCELGLGRIVVNHTLFRQPR